MKRTNLFCLLMLLSTGGSVLFSHAEEPGTPEEQVAANTPAAVRPAKWAVRLEKPGLPNMHQVAPGIYRGAQPSAEGFRELEKMGIKTIISLRAFHSDEKFLESTTLHTERISFKTWHPEDEDVNRFLELVRDTDKHPVFIHCLHGADRTGTMCAIYRIVEQGWGKEEAIEEMCKGGFGYHSIWVNLIRYLKKTDFDSALPFMLIN